MDRQRLDIIKEAGVVGAGGAGFPTHVKLDAKVDTLIINAAECEPLINVDKQLLEFYFENTCHRLTPRMMCQLSELASMDYRPMIVFQILFEDWELTKSKVTPRLRTLKGNLDHIVQLRYRW